MDQEIRAKISSPKRELSPKKRTQFSLEELLQQDSVVSPPVRSSAIRVSNQLDKID
jgi:hypothetical protein